MEINFDKEWKDISQAFKQIKDNSIDVYDALSYFKLDADIVDNMKEKDNDCLLLSEKRYKQFLYNIKTAARECNLRIFHNKIYCNNALLSTYLPLINDVLDMRLPAGQLFTFVNFSLFIPKLIDIGPITKATKKGNIKKLIIDEGETFRWEIAESKNEHCYYLIPATDNNDFTCVLGNNLALYANELKKYLTQNNTIKKFPKLNRIKDMNDYEFVDADDIDEETLQLLLKPFYKTSIFDRKKFLKGMSAKDITNFIYNGTFHIKKTNPTFNFCDKDFSDFLLCLKERFVKENHCTEQYTSASSYCGWEYLNYAYKYFPDKSTSDIKNIIGANIHRKGNNIIFKKQLRQLYALVEKYSDIDQVYKYNNEKFDYSFMIHMSETGVFLFSAALFSILQRFFKLADINNEATFALYILKPDNVNILPYVLLWTKLNDKFNCIHDCPFVIEMSENEGQKKHYQKQIDTMCESEFFPVIIGQEIYGKVTRKTVFSEFNAESATVYENSNQLHQSIVHLYYNFINYITDKLNENCQDNALKAPAPKKLIKQIKHNYRLAQKLLANDEKKDQEKINQLSYLLSSLLTFKDMLEKDNNVNVPINDIINHSVHVFKSQLTMPSKKNLENQEEICLLFKEFIEELKTGSKIGRTLVSRDKTKINDDDIKKTLSAQLIGWYDSKDENFLYLDYKNYFNLFEKFASSKGINMTLSQNKLQRLILYKKEILIPESRSEIPKFQCKRVIVSGKDKKCVLCIDMQKLNNI